MSQNKSNHRYDLHDRCPWKGIENSELYQNYHDFEWSKPVFDDQILFEFLVLESFQSGLSWLTILNKRENFREAFDGFDPKKIANFDEKKVAELMQNQGIIRNRAKILATINNAQKFLEMQKEFGDFSKFYWKFVDFTPIKNDFANLSKMPAKTEISTKISAELKRRGFKFLGPTVIYSHMQACGLVDDHIESCFCHHKKIVAPAKAP